MLQNLPPKRVCRQILPQLNQKPKNKKTEEKAIELSKAILDSKHSSKAEAIDEISANKAVPLIISENKKSTKLKNIDKDVEETVDNGGDAIVADKSKVVKCSKTIRKVNQKTTKDNLEDNGNIDLVDLQKNESKDDDSKKRLRSSPRNQLNTGCVEENTPTLKSTVKRKPKKISDCIAKLQEKLGLPFFGSPVSIDVPVPSENTNEVDKSPQAETVTIRPSENEDKLVKAPKRKSLTRKIVKTESLPSLSKKTEHLTSITTMKSIQIQAVHPTIQHQSTQHYNQKPIAHVEAIRPNHIPNINNINHPPPRRPSILQPTLVPPPPPPPIILPSTVTLPCEQGDTPLDLSKKPAFENGALDLSKASNSNPSEAKPHNIEDILNNKVATESQPKKKRNKKEVVSLSPVPRPTQAQPIVSELNIQLPNVSITSKCVLNVPQTPALDKSLEPPKKPVCENTQLVIHNFKGCVDIIKIPAPKAPVSHAEKPSVTIKAIPPPSSFPSKRISAEKSQEKGFIGAFESFIEKKAADNSAQLPSSISKETETLATKTKKRKPPKKVKGKYDFITLLLLVESTFRSWTN